MIIWHIEIHFHRCAIPVDTFKIEAGHGIGRNDIQPASEVTELQSDMIQSLLMGPDTYLPCIIFIKAGSTLEFQ